MWNLKIYDKVAFIALAITALIASIIIVALLGGASKVSTIEPAKTAQYTQKIIVREIVIRCRSKETGRFTKCP